MQSQTCSSISQTANAPTLLVHTVCTLSATNKCLCNITLLPSPDVCSNLHTNADFAQLYLAKTGNDNVRLHVELELG